MMPLPELAGLTDLALLLLRVMLGILFISSGWSHVREPEKRGESIGLSPGFTRVLGVAELLGGISVGIGAWAQVGALILAGVMFGSIYKKLFVWRTGFWGVSSGDGWFYDLLYLVCALVIATTGGGAVVTV